MAYYASELAVPPSYTVGGVVIQEKAGRGYPTSGPPVVPAYYPTTEALATTTNKSGNANSPGEHSEPVNTALLPYGYKTWEQKAAATVPPGVFATVIN